MISQRAARVRSVDVAAVRRPFGSLDLATLGESFRSFELATFREPSGPLDVAAVGEPFGSFDVAAFRQPLGAFPLRTEREPAQHLVGPARFAAVGRLDHAGPGATGRR